MKDIENVKQLSGRIQTQVNNQTDDIVNRVAQQLKSKIYHRDTQLASLKVTTHDFELSHPNLVNPNADDLSVTVHIIACIEAEVSKLSTMTNSGLWSFNFARMIALTHSLSAECQILREQIQIIDQMQATPVNVKKMEKVSAQG